MLKCKLDVKTSPPSCTCVCLYPFQVLQKKFDDFVHELAASEDRVQHVAKLATTRISEGHSAKEAIEERRTVLLQLWENVKVASGQRKASLARARELHTFNRDAAETKSRVQVCTYMYCSFL